MWLVFLSWRAVWGWWWLIKDVCQIFNRFRNCIFAHSAQELAENLNATRSGPAFRQDDCSITVCGNSVRNMPLHRRLHWCTACPGSVRCHMLCTHINTYDHSPCSCLSLNGRKIKKWQWEQMVVYCLLFVISRVNYPGWGRSAQAYQGEQCEWKTDENETRAHLLHGKEDRKVIQVMQKDISAQLQLYQVRQCEMDGDDYIDKN